MLLTRTFSSIFLLFLIFLAYTNHNFFNFFFIYFISFFINWEFLRLVNFYNYKYKTTDETINNFILTKSKLKNIDYLLILNLQIFLFFDKNVYIFSFIIFISIISKIFFDEKFYILKLLGLLYLTIPFVYLLGFDNQEILLENLIFLLIIIISTDLGGYTFGKLIGGPKIYTNISPNKTWIGLFGGIFFSCCISSIFFNNSSIIFLFVISFLSIICQIGDFIESYLKRKSIVKESSNLIPGHGGILDRLDGAIFLLNVMFTSNYFGFSFYNYVQ